MPESCRILLSKQAAKDMERIFDYVAKDSPDAGASLVGTFLQAIENLKLFPHRTVVEGQSTGVAMR